MGLLDDAIREHLELKRLRGADPGEVARAEHDALGSVPRTTKAGQDATHVPANDVSTDPDSSVFDVSDSAEPPRAAATGQETVELNMNAEMHSLPAANESDARAEGRATAVGHPAHTRSDAEESLEWEAPGDRSDDADGHPGHDDAADTQQSAPGEEEHVEDVLEETPDFLRETPEQDRLWFEQRPPRDFDFNE
jgi:hypothetical protein